jgi:hypothetical protein
MMLNGPNSYGHGVPSDGLGDCTISALGHGKQVLTLNASKETTPSDTSILTDYENWCGYVLGDESTDNGGVMLDILNDAVAQGLFGNKLDAYTSIHILSTGSGNYNGIVVSQNDMMIAIWLFGGAYIGVQLPISAQTQRTWHVPATPGPDDEPGSWGGHAIWVLSYNTHCLTCITWGQLQQLTWEWLSVYCDEAYGLVDTAWLKATGVSPSNLNLTQLLADQSYLDQTIKMRG